ncbi:MATE family efflux transporter [Ferrimonas senticii]|uniref:MATE family efflux transporter n=1 Tax=Ferrimonas senticii TaxID=394566 RepID=UPI00042206BC|nr:MATE family efflux transporter [Ferrimonas senticii]
MAQAVFTTGSTLRHILVMTFTSSIGLMTMFTVDLADMYFLSLLGQQELAAAIGFAGTLLFLLTAIAIGLNIAMGAMVSRAEGGRDRQAAARYCTNVAILSAIIGVVTAIPVWWFLPELLTLLGAKGLTHQYALEYGRILLPSNVFLAVGMGGAAALRAVGAAKLSMYATMVGGLVNAVLDPLFIFTFDWGLHGAAWASVVARVAIVAMAWIPLYRRFGLVAPPSWSRFVADLRLVMTIALPAMLTNLATPIGSSYVMKSMAAYGDSAVAGAAIIGRLAPVAFGFVFALSGAIGPIIGQNAGQQNYQRVREAIRNALLVNLCYVAVVWLLLIVAAEQIVQLFDASGDAAELITFYLDFLVGGFVFAGTLFITNACFNNLNRAHIATVFNFARAFLGTIPAVYLLSALFGAKGVMAGEMVGVVVWSLLAVWLVHRTVNQIEAGVTPEKTEVDELFEPLERDETCPWAYSSGQTQLHQQCHSHSDCETAERPAR